MSKEKQKGLTMPVLMNLGLMSGLKRLVDSKPQLRKDIDDLLFSHDVKFENIDWAKAKVFVPADCEAVPYYANSIAEINEFLRNHPNIARPDIAILGGNNGKYKNINSLESRLATILCKFGGYSLYPFINGTESKIIHKLISYKVPNMVFKNVEYETKSGNTKQNWDNAVDNGMLDNINTVVIVALQAVATRHIGTLKATLKSNWMDPQDVNIIAVPATPKMESEKFKKVSKILGITMDVPDGFVICDKAHWTESAWGLYRVFIELLSLRRYSKKGDVYLDKKQTALLNRIFDEIKVSELASAIIKEKTIELKKTAMKKPILQKVMNFFNSKKEK